jgi:acyl-ACP thioesterase
MDATTRRPARLSARFWEMYGEAVAGRSVSPRLTHPDPPAGTDVNRRQWPLRVSDIDVFDHVNNAATWAALDDELYRGAGHRRVEWAELEYRSAIDPGASLCLSSQVAADEARIWLVEQGAVQASGVVRFAPDD